MSNIEDLRARLKRLDNLLSEPHPGLITWLEAYARAVKDVQDFLS